jgi:hypothetical protein
MLPPPLPVSPRAGIAGNLIRMPWPGQNTMGKGRMPSGPRVSTPGQFTNIVNIPDFFSIRSENNVKPGYQEAHQMYDNMRDFFARQAFATNNMELVNLKATMMWLKPGNKNPSVVSVSIIMSQILSRYSL